MVIGTDESRPRAGRRGLVYQLAGAVNAAVVMYLFLNLNACGAIDLSLRSLRLPTIVTLIALTSLIAMGFYAMRGLEVSRQEARGRVSSAVYRKRLRVLKRDLDLMSAETMEILNELIGANETQTQALRDMEAHLQKLEAQEVEVAERVDLLREVPLPAMEYVVEQTEKAERRSARRDWLLFGLGVALSIAVAVVLNLVFGI